MNPLFETEGVRYDRQLFEARAIYPGHPVTIAWAIVNVYDNLDEALTQTEHGFPHALGNGSIPGAGGCVYNGLQFLVYLRDGMPSDEALAMADRMWADCDSQKAGGYSVHKEGHDPEKYKERWRKGQEQADSFKERLVAKLATWPLKAVPASEGATP